jgi:hypothetical protein
MNSPWNSSAYDDTCIALALGLWPARDDVRLDAGDGGCAALQGLVF